LMVSYLPSSYFVGLFTFLISSVGLIWHLFPTGRPPAYPHSCTMSHAPPWSPALHNASRFLYIFRPFGCLLGFFFFFQMRFPAFEMEFLGDRFPPSFLPRYTPFYLRRAADKVKLFSLQEHVAFPCKRMAFTLPVFAPTSLLVSMTIFLFFSLRRGSLSRLSPRQEIQNLSLSTNGLRISFF